MSCLCAFHASNGALRDPACRWCEAPLRQQNQIVAGFCGEVCIRENNRAARDGLTPEQARARAAKEAA